jgi:aspartate carbamoyltransferase catalytic subunit
MNRGLEISSAAADSDRSTVLAQVTNGVSIRMAVLYLLVAGASDSVEPSGGER